MAVNCARSPAVAQTLWAAHNALARAIQALNTGELIKCAEAMHELCVHANVARWEVFKAAVEKPVAVQHDPLGRVA